MSCHLKPEVNPTLGLGQGLGQEQSIYMKTKMTPGEESHSHTHHGPQGRRGAGQVSSKTEGWVLREEDGRVRLARPPPGPAHGCLPESYSAQMTDRVMG